jgi:integrase
MTKARVHYDRISIDRLPSGSWRYRVRDPNARRYDSSTFQRAAEDEKRDEPGTANGDRWAEAQLARYRLGLDSAEPAAIGTVVSAYLKQLGADRPAHRPLHPLHVKDVTRTLEGLAAFRPSLDLNKTTAARSAIREWLRQLQAVEFTKKGRRIRKKLTLSPRTKTRYLIHVKALVKWAIGEGMIGRDPVANLSTPAADRTIPPVFTLTQARAIVRMDTPADDVWLWAVLMLLAGLRRAEALALNWQDILWDQQLLKVTKGKGAAARLVPLQPDLREILAPLGGPDAKRPRIGRIVASAAFTGDRKLEWYRFRRLLRLAGVKADQGKDAITGRMARLHPHSCRHTFGGMMLASGWDSMLLRHAMGHQSADMTGDYSKSATTYRAEIGKEGWTPGRLCLLAPPAKARKKGKAG